MRPVLNIQEALQFLDMLDPEGRHTIASEHPTKGVNKAPVWEGGATYEFSQRKLLIEDICERQARGSNVYYSVNRPCPVFERQGLWGKNNIDDIISIRALAFDIDFTTKNRDGQMFLNMINRNLDGELKPSLIINSGGGFQLIYFLKDKINVKLCRLKQLNDEQKKNNEILISNRSSVTNLAHDFEYFLRQKLKCDLFKVDNMSNIDRVMRLPGTVNYPKLEKQLKGQIEALSHIVVNNHHKSDIRILRDLVPVTIAQRPETPRKPYVPPKNSKWTAYAKAKACCEYIRDNGLADSNEIYTLHVMLPLIGAIHDENDANNLTETEAEELFMLAISGGERFGTMGRGSGYFLRQWRSHRPNLQRRGTKSLGGLIWFAQDQGMKLPWIGQVMWEEDFERQKAELEALRKSVPDDIVKKLKDLF
jgi:hypothetical protein